MATNRPSTERTLSLPVLWFFRRIPSTLPVPSTSSTVESIRKEIFGFLRARSCMIFEARSVSRRCTMSTFVANRSEEHTSELQSLRHLVCRLLLEKKKKNKKLSQER